MKILIGAISPRLALLAGVLAIALTASTYVAVSQTTGPGDDPAAEPIPGVPQPELAQSIVAIVEFTGPTTAQLVETSVSDWPAPARTGGPPLIQIDVFDVDGNLIETFSDWHPLWVENLGEGGDEENGAHDDEHGFIVEETGIGRFVFPYSPNLGEVMITDIQEEVPVPLVEIDAHQIVVDYCETNPTDPGCNNVPGFCEADVNNDGMVNSKDLVIIAKALFTEPGDRRWDPRADLNDDDRVDVRDLLIALQSLFDPDCR